MEKVPVDMESSQHGSRLKQKFDISDVRQICARHEIKVHEVRSVTGSFNKKMYPRNILLNRGKFSRVIDWECSQYGEADFELCHLIHWCLYPPEAEMNFRPFLRSLLQSPPKCAQVPHLAQRLTIYQIEHEIQQVIWNSSQAESERVPRLIGWLAGDVDRLFRDML